jgi:hypothetical protein
MGDGQGVRSGALGRSRVLCWRRGYRQTTWPCVSVLDFHRDDFRRLIQLWHLARRREPMSEMEKVKLRGNQ